MQSGNVLRPPNPAGSPSHRSPTHADPRCRGVVSGLPRRDCTTVRGAETLCSTTPRGIPDGAGAAGPVSSGAQPTSSESVSESEPSGPMSGAIRRGRREALNQVDPNRWGWRGLPSTRVVRVSCQDRLIQPGPARPQSIGGQNEAYGVVLLSADLASSGLAPALNEPHPNGQSDHGEIPRPGLRVQLGAAIHAKSIGGVRSEGDGADVSPTLGQVGKTDAHTDPAR